MIDQRPFRERLFRTHVTQRSHYVAADRKAAFGVESSQAKVGDPKMAACVDQKIGRLDVAVHDANLMGVFQGLRRLNTELGDGSIERYFPCGPLGLSCCMGL